MPNLVGIGNSQVPTNAMLGGLAYQDPAHAVLINTEPGDIAPIKRTINKTLSKITNLILAVVLSELYIFKSQKGK